MCGAVDLRSIFVGITLWCKNQENPSNRISHAWAPVKCGSGSSFSLKCGYRSWGGPDRHPVTCPFDDTHTRKSRVTRIRIIICSADPDPAFCLNVDPDPGAGQTVGQLPAHSSQRIKAGSRTRITKMRVRIQLFV
jgi:hypothetical protein